MFHEEIVGRPDIRDKPAPRSTMTVGFFDILFHKYYITRGILRQPRYKSEHTKIRRVIIFVWFQTNGGTFIFYKVKRTNNGILVQQIITKKEFLLTIKAKIKLPNHIFLGSLYILKFL